MIELTFFQKMFIKLVLLESLAISILATPLQSNKFQIRPRIINGEKSESNEFPYMVSLREKEQIDNRDHFVHFCGGALISDRWVLSASHCFNGILSHSVIRIVVGSNDINDDGAVYQPKSLILHKEYNFDNKKNDIALLQTLMQIIFSERVQPIVISREWVRPGQTVVYCGFGESNADTSALKLTSSVHLRSFNMSVIRNDESIRLLNPIDQPKVHNSTICTFNDRSHTSLGDSGGPLVICNKLVGIGSWSSETFCLPSAFTRISEFTHWIEEKAAINAL